MELLIVVGLFVGLAVSAYLLGADSRPRAHSKEWHMAGLGYDWRDRFLQRQPPMIRPALETILEVRRLERLRKVV